MQGKIKDTLLAFFSLCILLSFFSLVNGYILIYAGSSSSLLMFLERNIFSSLLFSLPILFPYYISRLYLYLYSFIAILFGIANIVHMYLYGQPVCAYVTLVLKETNLAEAIEFIQQYIDIYLIIILCVYLFVSILQVKHILSYKRRSVQMASIIICIVLFIVGIRFYKKGMDVFYWNYMFDTLESSYKTFNENKALLYEIKKDVTHPNVFKYTEEPITLILVIGESSNRHHYSLYGYHRATNPYLEARKDELYVFTDVISPHAHTVASLMKVLTFTNQDKSISRSFIDIFQNAGYQVSFISNQPMLGIAETSVSKLFSSADFIHFTNKSNCDGFYQLSSYDSVVFDYLPGLDHSLNQLIVIHLMGSHSKYIMRYPASMNIFNGFTSSLEGHVLDKNQTKTVNEYDNTILYTDTILNKIIDWAEKSNKPTVVVYFSDHGETVYDDGKTVGHAEVPLRYMFEIPFIIWLSPEYKKLRPVFFKQLEKYLSRPIQTNSLIYSLCNLAQISFDGQDETKDFFSDKWQPQERIILDKTYETILSY